MNFCICVTYAINSFVLCMFCRLCLCVCNNYGFSLEIKAFLGKITKNINFQGKATKIMDCEQKHINIYLQLDLAKNLSITLALVTKQASKITTKTQQLKSFKHLFYGA